MSGTLAVPLEVKLFKRGSVGVGITALGEAIAPQAQQIIEQVAAIKETAKRGKDPLSGPPRLGEFECAIMAEPLPDTGLAIAPLYDEPFVVALPKAHELAKRKTTSAE